MKKFLIAAGVAFAMIVTAGTSAFAARLIAQVDISTQTMTVKKDGRVLHRWKVSTGKQGFATPTGTYGTKRMHTMWYSRKYDMSPMPYSIFFRGGYAIHGTNYVKSLGRPASHGCVRLQTANAKTLFDLTRQVGPKNMKVVITY